MKAIKRLLDECQKQGTDIFGFVHYIPKEVIDDAVQEYETLTRKERTGHSIYREKLR